MPSKWGTTKQRGYDNKHRRAAEAARANLIDGTPCSRCGGPMYRGQQLHLDHDDHDRTRYRGLAHAYCNQRAGALHRNAKRGYGCNTPPRTTPPGGSHRPSPIW